MQTISDDIKDNQLPEEVEKALNKFKAQWCRELDFCYDGGTQDAIEIATILSQYLLPEFFKNWDGYLNKEEI